MLPEQPPEEHPFGADFRFTVPTTGEQPDTYGQAFEDAVRYGVIWAFGPPTDDLPGPVVLP